MTPDANVASSPACHATRAGSAAPARSASAFAGSITRNTWANSDTVLMPYGSAQTSRAAGALGEPARLERVGDVADEDRDRRRRQDPAVDELGRETEHAAAQRVDQQQLDEIVEREAEEPVDVAANDPAHAGKHSRLKAQGSGLKQNLGVGSRSSCLSPEP